MADIPSHAQPGSTPTTAVPSIAPRPIAIKSVASSSFSASKKVNTDLQNSPQLLVPECLDAGSTIRLTDETRFSNITESPISQSPPPSTPLAAPASLQLFQQPRQPGCQVEPIPMLSISTSKKWVLPPRPKPGRKPSQDPPAVKRKAQNRAAQKAYRERRAAAAAATSVPDADLSATTPKGLNKKKKCIGKKIKEEEDNFKPKIKKQLGDDQLPNLLKLNEPSMDIKIKKEEELFNIASCLRGSDYIKTENANDQLAARQFSSTSRHGNLPELNNFDSSPTEDEGKEDTSGIAGLETIALLRAALSAANLENHRLNILVSDLRTEVAVLKDLKIAEKDFLHEEPQFMGKSSKSSRLSHLPPLMSSGGEECDLCDAAGNCVCDKLGLKANPFFGGDGQDNIKLEANGEDSIFMMLPQDPVPLRKRRPFLSVSKTNIMPKFKRLEATNEMDFTGAFTQRGGSLGWPEKQGALGNISSKTATLAGSSEISPGSDGASISTPMTSDDDDELMKINNNKPNATTNNDLYDQPSNKVVSSPKMTTAATATIKKAKRVVSATCCRTTKKLCTTKTSHNNADARIPSRTAKRTRLIIDPCGFCSNGTPCLCAEAAEQADSIDFV